MTTDQVIVYGGNDGTAETYNTVTVDRGNGPGQEQLVQQVGYSATASGALAVVDDAVSISVTGMAGAAFVLSGTFTNDNNATVLLQRSYDGGGTWLAAFGIRDGVVYTDNVQPGPDATTTLSVSAQSASHLRVVLTGTDLSSGAVGVIVIAQPVDPQVTAVVLASVTTSENIGVSINATDTTVPVELNGTVLVSSFAAPGSGAIAAVDELVGVAAVNGAMIQVTGDLDGTLVAELSLDGLTFVPVADAWLLDIESGASAPLDASGVWLLNIDGPITGFQVRCTLWNSGTANVTITSSGV